MQSPGGSTAAKATTTVAPYRCYCGEVQPYLQQQQQREATAQAAEMPNNDGSRNRLLPCRKLRVMGTVVKIDHSCSTGDEEYPHAIVIDDGTGLPPPMAASERMVASVQLGQTIDCVVRSDCTNSTTDTESSSSYRLVIESMVLHKDNEPTASDALALRSLEIVHARQGFPGRTWGLPNTTNKTASSENDTVNTMTTLTTEEIHNIIVAEPDVGVKLEDLQEFFFVDEQLHERIQELQMQGLIYQSQSGAYLPL